MSTEPGYFTPIGTFPPTASTAPSGSPSMHGVASQTTVYTFPKLQRRVEIQLRSIAPVEMYVRWNAPDASNTNWNRWLAPGDICFSPAGLGIVSLSIYFTANANFGEAFTVQGWE